MSRFRLKRHSYWRAPRSNGRGGSLEDIFKQNDQSQLPNAIGDVYFNQFQPMQGEYLRRDNGLPARPFQPPWRDQ